MKRRTFLAGAAGMIAGATILGASPRRALADTLETIK